MQSILWSHLHNYASQMLFCCFAVYLTLRNVQLQRYCVNNYMWLIAFYWIGYDYNESKIWSSDSPVRFMFVSASWHSAQWEVAAVWCYSWRTLLFGATEPRCVCYRALLFGGLLESRSDCCEVELKETNACAFKHILRYVYTAQMSLVDMQVGSVILKPLRTYRTNPNA